MHTVRTLVLQTDTTGRYNFRAPIEDPDQPHLARLSMLVSENGREVSVYSRLIKPRPGWEFEPDAVVGNGLPREVCEAQGVQLGTAMTALVSELERVDRVCAFNADFVRKVLEHAAWECGLQWEYLFTETPVQCMMRMSTDLVRKPRMAPGGGYAWPKLREAYEFFANDDLPPLDMDPIERGIALVRCVHIIHRGILDSQRAVNHE